MLDRFLMAVIRFLLVAGVIFTVILVDALARFVPLWASMILLVITVLCVIHELVNGYK